MSIETILDLFYLVVTLAILICCDRTIRHGERYLPLIFFTFSIACFVLSGFYWMAYVLLRPDTRMPFAANEIAEWAIFLLLGEALRTGAPEKHIRANGEVILAALFTAANTMLWIAWSGEWIQDILTGLTLGYLICSIVSRMKLEKAFAEIEWRGFEIICLLLIGAQTATFFVAENIKGRLDGLCYFLLFFVSAWLAFRAILVVCKKASPRKFVCMTFAFFCWNLITMYMSASPFYEIAYVGCIICLPFMMYSLIKEVHAK